MKKWFVLFPALLIIFVLAYAVSDNVEPSVTVNGPASYTMKEQGLHRFTNKERAKRGLHLLKYDIRLEASAKDKCTDMVSKNYWSHTNAWKFINKQTTYGKAGENLAYGYYSSREVVEGWMDSETHARNILDRVYTRVGYGICSSKNYLESGQQVIVVQHFASN